jgi:hypothetical protein
VGPTQSEPDPNGGEQEDIDQEIGERPVAAEDASPAGGATGAAQRSQGRDEDRGERDGQDDGSKPIAGHRSVNLR